MTRFSKSPAGLVLLLALGAWDCDGQSGAGGGSQPYLSSALSGPPKNLPPLSIIRFNHIAPAFVIG